MARTPSSQPAAVPYPREWECSAVLADGGVVHLRPVREGDSKAISEFHSRLSEQSRYLRYFSAMPRLLPALLERFTHVDYRHRMVLLALQGDDVIGMATYGRSKGTDDADVAFAVADAHQGRGLGTLLLEHLAALAHKNGIVRFTADTLPHNRRMLRVFRDAGFHAERSREPGLLHIRFPVEPDGRLELAVERREHSAEARSVGRLLAPRSIAVVASGFERSAICEAILRNLERGGFVGPVYAVRPTAGSRSEPTWASLRDVPGEVDLVVAAARGQELPAVVEACGELGVHGLVVVSEGIVVSSSEGDARADAARALVAAVRHHGMRLIGPRSVGILRMAGDVHLSAISAPFLPAAGRIGFLSQSGALGVAVLRKLNELGLGVSTFVSVGDKGDVSGNDLLQFWEEDEATDVVLLCLESLGNPRKFARIARRVSREKPIVALVARAASATDGSDPARLALSEAAVDALFHQCGVIRVDTLEQLIDTALLLVARPHLQGRRVAVVGDSRGAGTLATDACERVGLELPELSEPVRAELRGALTQLGRLRNPVDLPSPAEPDHYTRALAPLLRAPNVDAVLVIHSKPLGSDSRDVAVAIAGAARGIRSKLLVACLLADPERPAVFRAGPDGRGAIASFPFPESAAHALARVAAWSEWRRRPRGHERVLPDVRRRSAQRLISEALAAAPAGAPLDAPRVRALLASYGIELDLGGAEADAGRQAARAAGAPRLEASVRVVPEASFGPVLVFGLATAAAEREEDRAVAILPLTDRDARDLVRSDRSAPLLWREDGSSRVDVAALEDLLLRVSRLVSELPEVAELQLAPVRLSAEGARALGARVRVAPYRRLSERATRAMG